MWLGCTGGGDLSLCGYSVSGGCQVARNPPSALLHARTRVHPSSRRAVPTSCADACPSPRVGYLARSPDVKKAMGRGRWRSPSGNMAMRFCTRSVMGWNRIRLRCLRFFSFAMARRLGSGGASVRNFSDHVWIMLRSSGSDGFMGRGGLSGLFQLHRGGSQSVSSVGP